MKRNRGFLFGFVALAAMISILLAGCKNPSLPDPAPASDEMGWVTVSLGLDGVEKSQNIQRAARTVQPDNMGDVELSYNLKFVPADGGATISPLDVYDSTTTTSISLPVGVYTVAVEAWDKNDSINKIVIATGEKEGIRVIPRETVSANITLGPKPNAGTGLFDYSITIPTGASGTLTITDLQSNSPLPIITLVPGENHSDSILPLDSGYYKADLVLTLDGKIAGFSNEIIHIYKDKTSTLQVEYKVEDFKERERVSNFDLKDLLSLPKTGETPEVELTDTQYTGKISWLEEEAPWLDWEDPDIENLLLFTTFEAGKVYTAKISLTATSEYTFIGVGTNVFVYDAIKGTNRANGTDLQGTKMEVTVVFPATGPEGSLDVTIGFNEGITVQKEDGSGFVDYVVTSDNDIIVIYQYGTPSSLTLRVLGYTDIEWSVLTSKVALTDEKKKDNTLVLEGLNFDPGKHVATFTGYLGSVQLSKLVEFKVDGAPPSVFTSVSQVSQYLSNTTDDPAVLVMNIDFTDPPSDDDEWEDLLEVIKNETLSFIDLDLSRCSFGSTFDPGTTSDAFAKIVSLTLPDDATAIDSAVTFSTWAVLKNVSASGITTIYSNTFKDTNTLITVNLPEADNISASAFIGTALSTVNLPKATSIGNSAFEGISTLTMVNLPKATSIGNSAFEGSSLSTVNLPLADTIGESAFANCTALERVDFPKATSIGKSAFNGSSALAWVNLPLAETIGESAFEGCIALVMADLPSATSISESAFKGTTALTSVTLSVVETIAPDAFLDTGDDSLFIILPVEAPNITSGSSATTGPYNKTVTIRIDGLSSSTGYNTGWKTTFKEVFGTDATITLEFEDL
jgi:hypothetical protein